LQLPQADVCFGIAGIKSLQAMINRNGFFKAVKLTKH
jgi:hypothetical protein